MPYLRDRDVRVSEAGESFSDKDRKLVEGIRDHYAAVARAAELRLAELGERIPIVATGHLFTAGGSTVEGRITSYNVCYTKLLRPGGCSVKGMCRA